MVNVILILLTAFVNPPAPAYIDPLVLEQFHKHPTADVLVLFKSGTDGWLPLAGKMETKEDKGRFIFEKLRAEARVSQRSVRRHLTRNQINHRAFFIINGIHIPAADYPLIEYLSGLEEVARIEFNSPYALVKPVQTVSDIRIPESRSPDLAAEWGIERIQADTLWSMGITGKGTVLGSEDTGVELHPAIRGSYRGTLDFNTLDHHYNWHDAIHSLHPLNKDSTDNPMNNPCGLDVQTPCDDHNHGTHTVGTMAATDFQIGVAPEAKWIGCRCMERGWGTLTTYIECFEWFLAPTDLNGQNPDPSKAPHVINNSWGCPKEEGCNPSNFQTMEQVIRTLKAAGIFVTVSTGNEGSLGCSSIQNPPAIYEPSFSVGATAFNDTIASFSSRGPVLTDSSFRIKPNITAPGVAVRSTIRNGAYAAYNGTSMASPHVSGTVALLISAFPSLAGKVELLEDILEKSAEQKTLRFTCGADSGMVIPNIVYGYGRLNAFRAWKTAKEMLSTGIVNSTVVNIRAFPNPFSRGLVFDFAGGTLSGKLLIHDLHGRSMFTQSFISVDRIELVTSGWASGMYFYKIEAGRRLYTGKVVLVGK
ncbi:MAG TPA: S8 family peptidase [Saprospiraceae bacterium]|nr:S8 family peptidase [Saprospiraceae bacterium]HNT19479.1 S8 family peptidase [Saprospiraceae bacterium]